MSLDVEALRGHVTTALDDDALQLLLDAAYDAIEDIVPASLTERLDDTSGPRLMLSWPIDSVALVVDGGVELTETDYEVVGPRTLYRLTASRWYGTAVTYVPRVADSERDAVVIDLVNLSLIPPGVTQSGSGPFAESYPADPTAARDLVISKLLPGAPLG